MTNKKAMLYLILTVLAVALVANLGLAQQPAKGKSAPGAPEGGPQTTIQGKIIFMQSYGGYIVVSETPHEEYKIINENPKVLADLAKQDKPVTIEGRLPRGAYLLFIEKINGKAYRGQ
jgi:hypothetical protein